MDIQAYSYLFVFCFKSHKKHYDGLGNDLRKVRSTLELASLWLPVIAILYILRIRIVRQTTPCAPSSNMRTGSI